MHDPAFAPKLREHMRRLGASVSDLAFDAGTVYSLVLLQVGTPNAHKSDSNDPSLLSEMFFRIGGANSGQLAPRDAQLRGFNVVPVKSVNRLPRLTGVSQPTRSHRARMQLPPSMTRASLQRTNGD